MSSFRVILFMRNFTVNLIIFACSLVINSLDFGHSSVTSDLKGVVLTADDTSLSISADWSYREEHWYGEFPISNIHCTVILTLVWLEGVSAQKYLQHQTTTTYYGLCLLFLNNSLLHCLQASLTRPWLRRYLCQWNIAEFECSCEGK